MSELVARLNTEWRVVLIPAQGRTARAWCLERLAGDAWQTDFVVRSAAMLRWRLAGIEPIDDSAAAILAGLPDRVDRVDITPGAPRKSYQRKRPPGIEAPAENLEMRGSAAVLPRVIKMVPGVCIICATDFTYPAQHARTRTCSPRCAQINLRAGQRAYQARKVAEIAPASAPPEAPAEPVRAPAAVRTEAPAGAVHAMGEAETCGQDGGAIDADIRAYWWENHRVRL
jgi:hypothetical protein